MERYLTIKKSRNGRGIFAKKDFLKGESLFEVKGKFISGDVDEDIDERTRDNAFRFDKERYVSPGRGIGNFLNHSCNPNSRVVKIKGRLIIAAIKPIRRGDEVAIDYSTILAADDIWEMKCNCGAPDCRKVIKRFVSLPKPIKQKYIDQRIVPKYILG